jgi:protein-L-isoaspartate(D-aspartate) O-methyltransferase
MKGFLPFLFLQIIFSSGSFAQTPEQEKFAERRRSMVKNQIRGRGIVEEEVLEAFFRVERHLFVPAGYRNQAYSDHPLPIGYGQTISQPYIVAFMTEALDLQRKDKVLEIGTGSGYQAAILGELCDSVFSIEIVKKLGESASELLLELGYDNVQVRVGDGYQGWTEFSPFDRIIVTCAPSKIPSPLSQQLKEGGKMVIPVGDRGSQSLYIFEKKNGVLIKIDELGVLFVPMVDSLGRGY